MSTLQLFWYVLVAVLFAGFFFLEGFDFGIGMALKGVAHNDEEENALIESIGPHWDGNEVWLVTAGAAMFAAMPIWYASLFSGFYVMFVLILLGLIYRGVSFEFRSEMETSKYRTLWTWISAIASFALPFLFGVLFTAVVQGMPMDAQGNVHGHFTDYINWFSLVGGVAVALLSYMHGLNYMRIKLADSNLVSRAMAQQKFLFPILLVGEVAFAAGILFKTDFFQAKPVLTLIMLAIIVALTLISWAAVMKQHQVLAFLALGFVIVSVVALLFMGLFPRVMIADNPANSILLKNATSSAYTLTWMTIISAVAMPIVIGYQTWSFYVFRERITIK